MGRQYSFKTTRRTEYLDDVLYGIPTKDRSELLRQAITLGLIQMGMLDSNVVGFNTVQKIDIQPTQVKQTEDIGETIVTQTHDKGVTNDLPIPEFKVESINSKDIDLDSTLNNIKF